jgi:O-antigen ligase
MSNPVTTPVRHPPALGFPSARPSAAPLSEGAAMASVSQGLGYYLFLLVNILLFIRPEEIIPEFQLFPSYEASIILCLVFSLPAVYQQLRPSVLVQRPISLLALAMLFAVMFSHLFCPWNFLFIWGARMSAYQFLKVLVYYFLFLALLDTPAKLRSFLFWLGGIIFVLTTVTLLQWHEVIDIPNIEVAMLQREINDNTGELISEVYRLQSTGVYNDPNDFSLILVVGMAISLYGLRDPRMRVLAPLWLAALLMFGYALYLTKSRGGLLALMAAMVVLFQTRFGGWKTLLLSALGLTGLLVLFSGRATNISTGSATAQSRLQLWSEALLNFKASPLFGIGDGVFVEISDGHLVAHNSFVQCFAELGFFGGTIFAGMFYLAGWNLYRLGKRGVRLLNPDLAWMRPFITTVVGGYTMGLMSLSRSTVVPTFMIIGLATAYLSQAVSVPPLTNTRLSTRLVIRLVLVSAALLAVFEVYVRSNVQFGAS